jgi:hypothetical protein
MSDGAFPRSTFRYVCRFASVLRAHRLPRFDPCTVSRDAARLSTSVRAAYATLPQGPSLGSGLCCPDPSSLNRPHPPHSQAHPHFTALRLIGDALAVRCRLGDPRGVPSFCWSFFPNMPSFQTAGSPSVALTQFFPDDSDLHQAFSGSVLPSDPLIRFRGVVLFAASLFRYPLRPAELLVPLADLTGTIAQPTETFTPELSTGRSPFPRSGITTVVTEQLPPTGLAPARTTTELRCAKALARCLD